MYHFTFRGGGCSNSYLAGDNFLCLRSERTLLMSAVGFHVSVLVYYTVDSCLQTLVL
jgi:hypothetical protein